MIHLCVTRVKLEVLMQLETFTTNLKERLQIKKIASVIFYGGVELIQMLFLF